MIAQQTLEQEARALWSKRQEDCAKHGADIPVPTIEVRVDVLAEALAAARSTPGPLVHELLHSCRSLLGLLRHGAEPHLADRRAILAHAKDIIEKAEGRL